MLDPEKIKTPWQLRDAWAYANSTDAEESYTCAELLRLKARLMDIWQSFMDVKLAAVMVQAI